MTQAPPRARHPLGITRAVWTVDGTAAAVGVLRTNAARVLHSWGLDPDGDQKFAVLLVLTELVANAAVHSGSGTVDTEMWRDGDSIAVTVTDNSPRAPLPRAADPEDESGRGLFLVRSYAESSGCERRPAGKCVWAVIGPRPDPEGDARPPAAPAAPDPSGAACGTRGPVRTLDR
ncbi:ATP-binding protein [Kitasatospora sp. NPDC056446]|uniref:ATP-binding protein n=1 Tax=Kitasatospora sp. NPDC056446 TaxID=3345819 RepID=UPI003684AD7B